MTLLLEYLSIDIEIHGHAKSPNSVLFQMDIDYMGEGKVFWLFLKFNVLKRVRKINIKSCNHYYTKTEHENKVQYGRKIVFDKVF